MIIQNINTEECPECGAGVREEIKRDQHSNSHWNEHRIFKCGLELHFSPNFMKILNPKPCKNSEKYLDQKNKDLDFIDKTEDETRKNQKISMKLKEELCQQLKYLRNRRHYYG